MASPRLVRGALGTGAGLEVVSVFFLRRFFAGAGAGGVVVSSRPYFTTAARHVECGARTPASLVSGYLGGGTSAAIRARKCTGSSTRCVAPFLRGLRRRYATRPKGRIDMRSRQKGGLAP